jgi:hypothetical protein
MRYLKPYKIFESDKPEYDDDWKRPGNPVREELEVELREILLEVIDLGYRPSLSGFTRGISRAIGKKNTPYVWIKNGRRLPHDEFWNEITDTVERIKDYLTEKGFKVSQNILNEGSQNEQVYIYFDMINLNESIKIFNEGTLDSLRNQHIVDELNDISYELKDDGFDFNIEEYYWQPSNRQYIICRILPGEKDEINSNLVETSMRIIDCMYQKSYDLSGRNWVAGGESRLRVKRKVSSSYYTITPKELEEFIGIDFEIVELVFIPII